MGRKSTKENKNIYQISREKMDYTRETAAEKLGFISSDRIEKIENEKSLPHPPIATFITPIRIFSGVRATIERPK